MEKKDIEKECASFLLRAESAEAECGRLREAAKVHDMTDIFQSGIPVIMDQFMKGEKVMISRDLAIRIGILPKGENKE